MNSRRKHRVKNERAELQGLREHHQNDLTTIIRLTNALALKSIHLENAQNRVVWLERGIGKVLREIDPYLPAPMRESMDEKLLSLKIAEEPDGHRVGPESAADGAQGCEV